jgi:hypothetical protein
MTYLEQTVAWLKEMEIGAADALLVDQQRTNLFGEAFALLQPA